jgi:ubiquinone/menaquinone biosynthesis C-methylase UbiE
MKSTISSGRSLTEAHVTVETTIRMNARSVMVWILEEQSHGLQHSSFAPGRCFVKPPADERVGPDVSENDFRQLYTERADSYVRFIHAVGYPVALRSYFMRCRFLRSGLRILDAGCGTGVVSFAIRDALLARGFHLGGIDAFDLIPAMLNRFRTTLAERSIGDVKLAEANVLKLDGLPTSWSGYDMIASGSMLEYVPRECLAAALSGLRARLNETGTMVLFITRRNWLMKPLIEQWWRANLYTRPELVGAFTQAGFVAVGFGHFPLLYRPFHLWAHIVEASQVADCQSDVGNRVCECPAVPRS